MKKRTVIISICVIIFLGLLLYRTDIINSINYLICKNIDGSIMLSNADYELDFITNVSGSKDNLTIESDTLYIYEKKNKVIYRPYKGKRVILFSLGNQYYQVNKIQKLKDEDLEVIKKNIDSNKKSYSDNFEKKGDVMIIINQTNSYVTIDNTKSVELHNILEEIKK